MIAKKQIKYDYDKKEDILFVRFRDDNYEVSEEIGNDIVLDKNKKGEIIGFELFDVLKRLRR